MNKLPGIGAAFVGAFEDDKVAQILELPKHVKPVGIIFLGYPAETPEKLSRILIEKPYSSLVVTPLPDQVFDFMTHKKKSFIQPRGRV